jgi:hypothetical protein
MSTVSDFIGRVADPFRAADSAPKTAAVHGGGFVSSSPAVATWLDNAPPEVSGALAEVAAAVSALEGDHEGALGAFNKARERALDAQAAESRAQYDAREMGRAIDPDLAKRLRRDRQTTSAASEDSAARLSVVSNGFAHTRDALNSAVLLVGSLAAEGRGVVVAEPLKLPKGVLADIIHSQRQVLADLQVEHSEVEAAPPPLEDAIEMVRASIGREAPRIILGAQRVDWTAPQQRLNVAPRLGEGAIDIDDPTKLIGWLFGDVLGQRLEALVRDRYLRVEQTFTPIERRKALAAIDAGMLQAQRIEVAAIRASWAAGDYVPLRRNTSPMALLGIERVTEGAQDPEGYRGSAYLGEVAR